jgi:hypothetical protein
LNSPVIKITINILSKSYQSPFISRPKLLGLIFLGVLIFLVLYFSFRSKNPSSIIVQTIVSSPSVVVVLPTVTPTPEPTPIAYKTIDHYSPPVIPRSSSYTLLFVGDSMTESLGINFDDLRIDLKKDYPNTVFGLFNYGFGSTNILSVEDRLHHDTPYQGVVYPAILNRGYHIIFIESFGNNPLSQFSLDEGLRKQTAALDLMVAELNGAYPKSLIVFVATIAPSQSLYGKGVVTLSLLARNQWANERRAYIENHISYAKSHNIPLINIYAKTMDNQGLALTKYLNPSDYIHPSVLGVSFISQTIADYLFQNHILLN